VLWAGEIARTSTLNHFPIDSFVHSGETLDLTSLSKRELNSTLTRFLKLKKTASTKELREPINLALGYLYFLNEEFKLAIQTLDNRVSDKFFLGDYSSDILSQSLSRLAERNLEKANYLEAIKNLDQAIKLRLQLLQDFPGSPFIQTLGVELSELERIKGRVYSAQKKFDRSILFYRRALVRDFESSERRSSLLLELAELYQTINKIPEAIEIFTALASKEPIDPEIEKKIKKFVSKFEDEIRADKGASQILLAEEQSFKPEIKENEIVRYQSDSKFDDEFLNNWRMFSFIQFSEKSKFILTNFPGAQNSAKIIDIVVQKLSDRLSKYSWNKSAQSLINLLPPKKINELALSLWRRGRSTMAAKCYGLIVDKFPMEIKIAHKSLFFLGRIFEDKKQFSKARGFYQRLMESYPQGVYTGAAAFKIPWIHRLQNNKKEAIEGFKNAIIFYKSPHFEELVKEFSVSSSFLPASYFWLAQTAESMKGFETRDYYLKELIAEHPFSFYAFIGRSKIGKGIGDAIDPKNYGLLKYRDEELKDSDEIRLYRAEALVSVGFFQHALDELNRLHNSDNASNGFLFYLARLYSKSQSYKEAIGLIWEIIDREDKDMISLNLAKTLFPQVYWELVSKHAKKKKISPFLTLALSRQESAFQKDVISKANAVGLMQLLPQTAREVARSSNLNLPDEESLKDPKINIPLGVEYLNRLLKEFGGNIPFALAAYNAGPHKVQSWKRIRKDLDILEFIESIPYRETRGYVKKVLRNYLIYLALYQDRSIKDIKKLLTNSFN
jgi:soluble lytic murein transglycosylase-like protein